ncbi:hypothetical protein ANOM_002986 [Aspergillus nomiae NRRL 13137]|uniref:MYND-type domain-containing protein n=1 Tax=Aspergillus nomiae NRRL (strain ATCC 15546 / NRRL 13137 / CBS 260.88 / M93) TaxID=1509407 RepID=A0A0L1JCH9_ASPN3|nr:uncharacterized protein ANOM_002986 [Aspergillus nomiae NRRL 13137]KNG89153.1 hypothetical protein ANOM_002986 [Aspergillus nomiae NRRL 13137]
MQPFLCANWRQDHSATRCLGAGTKGCTGCHLVMYCGKDCQTAHWPVHKLDCKNPMRKAAWRPAWEVENRVPHFIDNSDEEHTPVAMHGGSKYLWGNVPAFDLLQLKDNEGEDYSRDLSLLLAASGDLRNLVKTIVSLPGSYRGRIHIDINDRDETVVARNLVFLLVAFHLPPDVASVAILHLWYSAFLPESLLQSVRGAVFPAISEFLAADPVQAASVLQKMWSCRSSTLSAALSRTEWDRVLSYLPEAPDISYEKAAALHESITLAHSRRDYRDRALFPLHPSWRLSLWKFRSDGILLPFGASREDFRVPNPTLFHNEHPWPMPDSADPLQGWTLTEILRPSYGAKHDLYGQLYVSLKRNLHSFCERLHTLKLSICLFKQDAMDLPDKLATLRGRETFYDRIELANIADLGYLGPAKTLALFGPLLKARNENPKATLIMLFLNATREMSTPADQLASMPRAMETLQRFLPMRPRHGDPKNKYNAEFLNQMSAADLFTDNDTLFNRLVERARFRDMGRLLGLGMKIHNSIVAKWPLRLGDNPTQHEFEMAFWSGHTGCERYVEWHRVG